MSTAMPQKQSLEEQLICPITLELPFDPVLAEDGQVYERAAIEEYFEGKDGDKIQSPFTKQEIGKGLVPDRPIKNSIEASIANGYIKGDLAKKWKEKEQQKKKMDDLLEEAEGGDGEAMAKVGKNFLIGKNGFKKDEKMAYKWFDKADAAGNVGAKKFKGNMLLMGNGVSRNQTMGAFHLGIAAERGSDLAAYQLGNLFANGHHGFPVDAVKAIYWFNKSLSSDCMEKDMTAGHKRYAQEKVKELESIA